METYALRLTDTGWVHLGGDAEAKKPFELVVRAFDQDVEIATGAGPDTPSGEPIRVPAGEGRRLEGRHFFVRPTKPGAPCRITHRGVVP